MKILIQFINYLLINISLLCKHCCLLLIASQKHLFMLLSFSVWSVPSCWLWLKIKHWAFILSIDPWFSFFWTWRFSSCHAFLNAWVDSPFQRNIFIPDRLWHLKFKSSSNGIGQKLPETGFLKKILKEDVTESIKW